MTKAAKLLLGLALAAVCHRAALGQESQRPQTPERDAPYEIIRAIAVVQDQAAMGDGGAKAKLPKLISQIADRLLGLDAAVWREPRNARAAIVYTLSGGQPRVIRKILESAAPPQAEADLMAGALAYVEGREAKAKQILMPIDALAAAPPLGGYLALAQSALIAKEDRARALRLLDAARILAPGTLLEEAALRRSALLADETGDLGRFIAASSQYIRRFQRSVYNESFRSRFADAVVRFGLAADPVQRKKLTSFLSELQSAEQLRLYLAIAQSGILKGAIEPAAFAAGEATRLSRETGLEAERARLYAATTMILARAPEAGLSEVAAIDASRLSKRDAELRNLVARLGAQIQTAGAEGKGASDPQAAEGRIASLDQDSAASPAALLDAAQSALNRTDMVLGRASP